jgi:hypothetical protein
MVLNEVCTINEQFINILNLLKSSEDMICLASILINIKLLAHVCLYNILLDVHK